MENTTTMRTEDWADVRNEETVLDLTREQADQLRAEYEADQAAKALRKAEDRAQWNQAAAIARRRMTELTEAELAADLAWARSVLVDGETFRTGDALFLALYTAKKASLTRALGTSEISRLRRVIVELFPAVAEQSAVA